nr:magnesium transporter [uncultured Sulfurimonas sp.]
MKLSSLQIIELLEDKVKNYLDGFDINVHPYDIAELLIELRDYDEKLYLEKLSELPEELKAAVFIEFPKQYHEEIIEHFTPNELAEITNTLDTDDGAELIRNIEDVNEDVADEVLQNLPQEDRKNLEALISFGEYEAGSYMQTELFSAFIDEQVGDSIRRLKRLKAAKELDSVYQVYVITRRNKYLGSIPLEDLILLGPNVNYDELVKSGVNTITVNARDDIHDVVEIVSNYDMGVIPVIDSKGKLLGRITSDDIYDVIEERATGQLYNLVGVNDEAEQEESIFHISKHRAFWLAINLLTAIAASLVIGLFDTALQSFVALAVLMPIVASMGGNAGSQTLTVTVRQMSLGDISDADAKKTIKKEVYISLINGAVFSLIIGLISWIWFSMPLLGVVIAISMVVNLITAGFFGSLIPVLLNKADIDPAVGSSVLLTTVTDIVGFFSFLGLASIILL